MKNAREINANRDIEMENLAEDLAGLLPVSENLKEENEQYKEEIDQLKQQIQDGEDERISMLG